ncbi:MAG TPA: RNA polymerase sigma factor [Frankiaceae bacterium]|jgi:RNA polymerase sigma-70 factor (ECF subfamily)|nr:RNA polymerase sigma factor [Frankiaceae bacterium]
MTRDADDFDAVVRDHSDAVYGFVLRRVGVRATAEDLAQETFLRAWRARRSLREVEAVRAWLLSIALNVVRDDARRRSRRVAEVPQPEHLDVPALGDDPADRAAGTESLAALRDALAALPARHREMFLLRERDGLSYAAIASLLDCPIGSVMSGLSRARARLLEAVR